MGMRTCKNGHSYEPGKGCPECRAIRKANWCKANPGYYAVSSAKWRKANPGKHVVSAANWRKANPGKDSKYSANWRKANPGKRNALNAKRRAAKLQRTPKWADLEAIKQFYINCPEGYDVDHIIPLQGNNVSGFHVLENLQYLTKSENCSKGNKFNA